MAPSLARKAYKESPGLQHGLESLQREKNGSSEQGWEGLTEENMGWGRGSQRET